MQYIIESMSLSRDHELDEQSFWDTLFSREVPAAVDALTESKLLFIGNHRQSTDSPVVHNHPEVAVVLDGTVSMETVVGETILSAGALILVAPWMYHLPVPVSDVTEILWLAFTQTHLGAWLVRRRLEEPDAEEAVHGIDMVNFAPGYDMVNGIIAEAMEREAGWFRVIQNDLSSLFIRIRRTLRNKDRLLGERDRHSRTDTLVLAAQDYIERNYTHDISMSDVAHYVALSSNYFANLFKKRTGETIGEYITTVRMREAQRLLRDTDLMISEIAYAVGYRSPYYFSRVFRYAFDQPPSAYRESTGRMVADDDATDAQTEHQGDTA